VEYPANVYPWWAQEQKGVRLVFVPPGLDGRIPIESFINRMSSRTRLVAVSHVQFSSGYRQDLAKLGELCKSRNCLFFVDAIQSFSVFPIDVINWGIDALATGVHKWLLGPTGVGFFYCSPALREQLNPVWVGADSMVDGQDYLNYHFELLPDGRRFESATLNFSGIAGVRAALELVHQVGMDFIRQEIWNATGQLSELLCQRGFTIFSPRGEDEWSGILSVKHPTLSPDTLFSNFKRCGMITAVRDQRWRLSPHAYHHPTDFTRMGDCLDQIIKQS
jgi:selenocysteine lyase/cysteine desulfurase